MDMEMSELRSFLVLADTLHFRKASEQLFLSQPALSKKIRRLEEKVRGPLFTRTRRKVALTKWRARRTKLVLVPSFGVGQLQNVDLRSLGLSLRRLSPISCNAILLTAPALDRTVQHEPTDYRKG